MIAEYINDMLPSEIPKVIGELPSTHDEALSIQEMDGSFNTEYFGSANSSTIFGPLIRITMRTKSYDKGQQWVKECRETLHRYHGGVFVSIIMIGDAMYLGRTKEKLHEFQMTFKTQTEMRSDQNG